MSDKAPVVIYGDEYCAYCAALDKSGELDTLLAGDAAGLHPQ